MAAYIFVMTVVVLVAICFFTFFLGGAIDEARFAIKTQIADLQRSMEEKLAGIQEQARPVKIIGTGTGPAMRNPGTVPYRGVPRVVDYEASQQAALKEFEPEGHPV